MRPPSTVSTHHHHQLQSNEHSIGELQEMTKHQQEQIKQNQQLLHLREQRLNFLTEEQTNLEHLRHRTIQREESKHVRWRNLRNQLHTQPSIENQLDLLKQIYLNKEQELSNSLSKLDESSKQLEQIRKLKFVSEDPNQLEKLRQELTIRTNLNEQQSRQINYQRQSFLSKQNELNQLDQRIDELQKRKRNSSISKDFRTALNSVQDTLNNINIAEIEKRMVQLANSFNSVQTNEQVYHSNSPKKISKIAFASKSEIAATYMTHPLGQANENAEQQPLPAKLRLNDDILSIQYNNITSNIKKRHSISDSNEILLKYLAPSDVQPQQQPIQVRDESETEISLSEAREIIVECEHVFQIPPEEDEDEEQAQTMIESGASDTESEGSISDDNQSLISFSSSTPLPPLKSLLKTATTPKNTSRRVFFDPLALLLDAAVLGELDLLIKSAREVPNVSEPNDEGLTALHNAVCSSNFQCIEFLVQFGCDINFADNDGWTPLHCAASCNNTSVVRFLIEHGACLYATTSRDNETAAEKCEEEEENYSSCYRYLLGVQNDLGRINDGLVYALYDYEAACHVKDELQFESGDALLILRRGDECESEWWWARAPSSNCEGYVPRNYLGLHPRVRTDAMRLTSD